MEPFRIRVRSIKDKSSGKSIRVLHAEDKNRELKERVASVIQGEEMVGWFFLCWNKDLMPSYSYELKPFQSVFQMHSHVDRCMNVLTNDVITMTSSGEP